MTPEKTLGDSKTAVLLCGHGSRDTDGVAEFETFYQAVTRRLAPMPVDRGYLEFAAPNIGTSLDALYDQGARKIVALPIMLFAAGHVKNDIPSELNSFAAVRPDVAVEFARELALEPKLIAAAGARIKEAEDKSASGISRADSLLLVVGRGTNDPDANGNISKLARMLWEGLGYGWAEVAFSGVTEPKVGAALDRAAKLGFKRIVVFPYFLFTGVLVKRVYTAADEAALRHPGIEILKADYLKDHPLVIETIVERMGETDIGMNVMNCRLCKYREQVLGYEAAAGQAQVGHHHHVRAPGEAPNQNGHDHGGHDHGHHAHDGHGHAHGHDHPQDHSHDHDHAHPHERHR
jgi:sirohydrochlorin cobaltochelatase